VAKLVRRDVARREPYAGASRVIAQRLPECLARHRSATLGEEQRALRGVAHEQRTIVFEVARDLVARRRADRDEAGLVALAGDAHEAVVQVDVGECDVNELGDPQPRRVRELDHRGIAAAARRIRRLSDQLGDGFLAEHARQAARGTRCVDQRGGIGFEPALADQVTEHPAHRDERARTAAR
jgi:hypothetical protein